MSGDPTRLPEAAMVDVKYVAALGGCSTRHIRRLNDAGLMPAPVRLGHLLRWRRAEIEEWFSAGCPRTSDRDRSDRASRT